MPGDGQIRLADKGASYARLPKELRVRILQYTDIVRRWPGDARTLDGLYIGKNKVVCGLTCYACCCAESPRDPNMPSDPVFEICSCHHIPTQLFHVNKSTYYEAREVLFSRNRFVCEGNFPWLIEHFSGRLSDTDCAHFREIDFVFDNNILPARGRLQNPVWKDWLCLVTILSKRVIQDGRPPKLWLSIDTTRIRLGCRSFDGAPTEPTEWITEAHDQILSPVYLHLQGRLKRFHALFCETEEAEKVAERVVMGPAYNSYAEGKPQEHPRYCGEPHTIMDESFWNRPTPEGAIW